MKIFLIIDETHFFQPNFVAEFIQRTPDQIIGAALVTKAPKASDLQHYLITHWYYLKLNEIIKLLHQTIKAKILNLFPTRDNQPKFYSVKKVLKHYHVPFFKVKNNINKSNYLNDIKSYQPDVIVSSNPLIFKRDLLNLPKICCINRHSSLLPSYGGLWPIFQAYLHGEKYTGASVHTMKEKIDQGILLAQQKIPIYKKSSIAELYQQSYQISVNVLLQAISNIKKNKFIPIKNHFQPSYYSWPTHEHWTIFRKKGGSFI